MRGPIEIYRVRGCRIDIVNSKTTVANAGQPNNRYYVPYVTETGFFLFDFTLCGASILIVRYESIVRPTAGDRRFPGGKKKKKKEKIVQ